MTAQAEACGYQFHHSTQAEACGYHHRIKTGP